MFREELRESGGTFVQPPSKHNASSGSANAIFFDWPSYSQGCSFKPHSPVDHANPCTVLEE